MSFQPRRLPINTAWAFIGPDNRNPLYGSAQQFQPINIDSLAGLTVHWRADVALTFSANKVSSILNTSPIWTNSSVGFGTTTIRPLTSSAFSDITPIVPYFSTSTTSNARFTASNSGAPDLKLSSAINIDNWHFFAVFIAETTGTIIPGINSRGLAGDSNNVWSPCVLHSTGVIVRYSATVFTGYVPYQTGTRYIVETSFGSAGPLSATISLNGGTPATGAISTIVGVDTGASFFVGTQDTGANNTCDAHIAEMCVFSKSLDAETATNIRKTLGLRWGITTL